MQSIPTEILMLMLQSVKEQSLESARIKEVRRVRVRFSTTGLMYPASYLVNTTDDELPLRVVAVGYVDGEWKDEEFANKVIQRWTTLTTNQEWHFIRLEQQEDRQVETSLVHPDDEQEIKTVTKDFTTYAIFHKI